jgi:hypothetical protein
MYREHTSHLDLEVTLDREQKATSLMMCFLRFFATGDAQAYFFNTLLAAAL